MSEWKPEISKASARLFYEECMGTHNGEMAAIPNNPSIKRFCEVHGVKNKANFASFLKEMAKMVEKENDHRPF